MMTKKEIRNLIIHQKKSLPFEWVKENSEIIAQKAVEHKMFQKCERVFVYMPFNEEVRTEKIIETAWSHNKKVAIPKIINKKMAFYYINDFNEVKKGFYNILEPINNNKASMDHQTLVIMPGLAFDTKKNRIGYGGGYYDQYLDNQKPLYKIAITFDFQVLKSIPNEPNDIKPDEIMTEKRIIN
ncbi:5-formyltetrahydrofolate cyclo-ligase [Natranaerovirga hydrolytica]|uniref:5-formyltetrahydrofolate cyclo-ligase n=1 Tax=Natranaerovirga hydrolytica TaxID=680378 RepID=A0A4R1N2K3_9FIRM|nr:5-formyltetrahydrofolate cyclo-ligase [Natranaerovirga hydrolytica]TCK98234.1 5-formyltetrahydrofolate cyclo-ligase [Natranaerovirga hydrolytica]